MHHQRDKQSDGVGTLRNMKEEFETNDSKEELQYLSSVGKTSINSPSNSILPWLCTNNNRPFKAIKDNDLKTSKIYCHNLEKLLF